MLAVMKRDNQVLTDRLMIHCIARFMLVASLCGDGDACHITPISLVSPKRREKKSCDFKSADCRSILHKFSNDFDDSSKLILWTFFLAYFLYPLFWQFSCCFFNKSCSIIFHKQNMYCFSRLFYEVQQNANSNKPVLYF